MKNEHSGYKLALNFFFNSLVFHLFYFKEIRGRLLHSLKTNLEEFV